MAIITVSRGTLSGGEAFAAALGQRLGCQVISREVIVEAAKTYGVSEAELLEGLQSPPGFWARLTHAKERFVLATQAALAEMVQDGNAIYHGYAGPILLRGLPQVVKVRLLAPIDYRVRTAMAELGLTAEQARTYLDEEDAKREKWFRCLYHEEWADHSRYDIVLNLANLTKDSAVEVVAGLVQRAEAGRTAASDQELKDFALATRVRAEIVFRSSFASAAVEVRAEGGAVILGGAYFERHRSLVGDFVRQVKGVREVRAAGERDSVPAGDTRLQEKRARDVMLPIESYPALNSWNTIHEAFIALSASSVMLRDGHVISPRFLLVNDEGKRLVGVVARRDLLRGLVSRQQYLEATQKRLEALPLHFDVKSYFPETFRWISLFSPMAIAHAKEPVRSVMAPIKASVGPDDDLSTVVTTMLAHAVDLVPVISAGRPVGVILMTEVFDSVAEYIFERGGKPGA